MRFIGPRVAAALATLLALTAGPAFADRWVRTVYVDQPTTFVPTTFVPTTFVPTTFVPTTFVPTTFVPTTRVINTSASYFVPTSFSTVMPASMTTTSFTTVPTSYVVSEPQYVTTTFVRRPGLLRRLALRPVIETSRTYRYETFPTTSFVPTTISYEAPMTMATTFASPCGETTVPFDPPQGPTAADTSKTMTSTPENGTEPTYNEKAATKATPVKKADPRDAPKDPVDTNATGAGGLNAPADEAPPKIPTDPRTSFKPQYKEVRAREGTTAMPRLRGEVVSGVSGDPKANLEVIFTDLKNTYPDKKVKTDAKGAFEVFLPNGGWLISVVDPAAGGKPKEYLKITSTNGRYLDEDDAPLAGLRINN